MLVGLPDGYGLWFGWPSGEVLAGGCSGGSIFIHEAEMRRIGSLRGRSMYLALEFAGVLAIGIGGWFGRDLSLAWPSTLIELRQKCRVALPRIELVLLGLRLRF